jgi:hypothetical protein
MELFNRISPVYKSAANKVQAYAQTAATNGLSGLLGSLFGRSAPVYKTVDGQSAKAPASSSGWWGMFSASPTYKKAPAVIDADADACFEDAGEPGVDESGACIADQDQIVVL